MKEESSGSSCNFNAVFDGNQTKLRTTKERIKKNGKYFHLIIITLTLSSYLLMNNLFLLKKKIIYKINH